MSNNKDFKVKNGIKPTSYFEGVGTVNVSGNVASLDLSTGSVFDYAPTSDVQVTLSNPAASGTVSQGTLLLKGTESTGVGNTFSTTLYTGNGSVGRTITNGIDLATDGGLVWTKCRSHTNDGHTLYDTARGVGYKLATQTTAAQVDNGSVATVSSFNSDGYTIPPNAFNSDPGKTYVSWTFKEQANLFDIVTYTGSGSVQNIAHNLGSVPGMVIVKRTSSAAGWGVYHRSIGGTGLLTLSDTTSVNTDSSFWGDTDATATHFTVGAAAYTGQNAEDYVAYVFGHDTASDSLIKCGSYTGTGSSQDITLGWEPQWLIIKRTNSSGPWYMMDTQRGFPVDANPATLQANSDAAEGGLGNMLRTSTGFNTTITLNDTYVYMAIRAASLPTITYDTSLKWPGGIAPTTPATGETDVITFNTSDGGTTYSAVQAIDGAK